MKLLCILLFLSFCLIIKALISAFSAGGKTFLIGLEEAAKIVNYPDQKKIRSSNQAIIQKKENTLGLDDFQDLSNRFIKSQMVLPLSYIMYKHEINSTNQDKDIINACINYISNEIRERGIFFDFLPSYYWGVIDAGLNQLGMECDGSSLAQITIGMMQLYGRENGALATKTVLDRQNDPSHPDWASTTKLRVKGSLEFESFLKNIINKNAENNIISNNLFGRYLSENKEEYLLEVIQNCKKRLKSGQIG